MEVADRDQHAGARLDLTERQQPAPSEDIARFGAEARALAPVQLDVGDPRAQAEIVAKIGNLHAGTPSVFAKAISSGASTGRFA